MEDMLDNIKEGFHPGSYNHKGFFVEWESMKSDFLMNASNDGLKWLLEQVDSTKPDDAHPNTRLTSFPPG